MKIALLTTIFAFMIIGVSARAEFSCEGNACSSVKLEWTGKCYVAKNNHYSKKIAVVFRPHVTLHLNPGASDSPKILNNCLKGYTSPLIANFISQDCTPSRNLDSLGYSSGHKTRYCFSEGYDSYEPIPNNCIRSCPSNEIRMPLKRAGYPGSGHKTNLCISKGYRSYRPAPAGDKPPWGYCYK